MNNLYLYIFAIIAGMLIPIQAASNIFLNRFTGNILYSSLILISIGLLFLILLIIFLKPTPPSFGEVLRAPIFSYVGGVIIIIYIITITSIAPKLGVGSAVLLIVISQIFSSAIIDHIGLFGLPILPFNYKKLAGLICVIAGLILINHDKLGN